MRRSKPALGWMLVLLPTLAGCSLIPEYRRPAVAQPTAWRSELVATAAATPVAADWWKRFGSAELNALVAAALADNHDLRAAIRRIDEARALARIAGAPLYPSLDGSGSASHSRRDSSSRDEATATTNTYGALLAASYELDLGGGNRAAAQSAQAAVEASLYDRDTVTLVLATEAASTYFGVLALRDRLAIARDNLASALRILSLVEARYREGLSSALEVAQQRSAVAALEAEVPRLAQQLRAAENALAVLLGRAPQGFAVGGTTLASLELPAIAPGQPSALLERRPDIRSAEADLLSANADIGAARAAFFPRVELAASGGVSGLIASGSPATTIANVAAGLTAPIFQGGRIEGGYALATARYGGLVETYRQTVLTAFREVEDALAAVQSSADREAALETAAAEAQKAYWLSTERYKAGAIDFLTVLDAQRTQLQAEDSLVQARLDRYTAAASLFKALGGGWSTHE